MFRKLIYPILGLLIGAGVLIAHAYPILSPVGGGTGISTSTSGNNGYNLYQVSVNASSVPTYGFQVNGSGGGGSSTLIFAGNGILVNASGTNGYIIINNGVTSTIGNWSGTWQGNNSSTFLTGTKVDSANSITGAVNWLAGGTGLTVASSGQNITYTWTNPGYITSAPATTTINNLQNPTFTFTAGGTGLTVASSAPGTIAYTWTNPGYISTSTGLTVSNFASPNISQWTNNSGYITTSTNNFGGLTGNSTSSYAAYYTGATTLGGSSNYTFNSATGLLTIPTSTITTSLSIGTTTQNGFLLIGSSTPAFTVLSNGNVGIGTTAPSSTLHVVGDLRVSQSSTLSSVTIADNNLKDNAGNKYSTSTGSGSVNATGTVNYYPFYTATTTLSSTSSVQAVGGGANTSTAIIGNLSVGTSTTSTSALLINTGVTGTSTISLGQASNTACMEFRDSNDGAFSYATFLGGVMFVNTGQCP